VTFVGHSLVGVSLAAAGSPNMKNGRFVLTAALFAVFANFPDFAFRIIPYYKSHSLVTVLAILAVALLLMGLVRRRAFIADRRLILLGSLAVISHLLLDTFYNHGQGLMLFWPLSESRQAFPIPWLSVLPPPYWPITERHINVWRLEFATFAPLLVLVLLGKFIVHAVKQRAGGSPGGKSRLPG
jgi:membrane-bound metal-dependent hydrolase YbcI (DUF457 family)